MTLYPTPFVYVLSKIQSWNIKLIVSMFTFTITLTFFYETKCENSSGSTENPWKYVLHHRNLNSQVTNMKVGKTLFMSEKKKHFTAKKAKKQSWPMGIKFFLITDQFWWFFSLQISISPDSTKEHFWIFSSFSHYLVIFCN